MKALMSLAEAAAHTPWSVEYLRQACRTSDPRATPPPLKAKRGPRGQFVIRAQDLQEWIDNLPDL